MLSLLQTLRNCRRKGKNGPPEFRGSFMTSTYRLTNAERLQVYLQKRKSA